MPDHDEEKSRYIFCQIEDGTILVVDRDGPDFQRLTERMELDWPPTDNTKEE